MCKFTAASGPVHRSGFASDRSLRSIRSVLSMKHRARAASGREGSIDMMDSHAAGRPCRQQGIRVQIDPSGCGFAHAALKLRGRRALYREGASAVGSGGICVSGASPPRNPRRVSLPASASATIECEVGQWCRRSTRMLRGVPGLAALPLFLALSASARSAVPPAAGSRRPCFRPRRSAPSRSAKPPGPYEVDGQVATTAEPLPLLSNLAWIAACRCAATRASASLGPRSLTLRHLQNGLLHSRNI
jgi:hypothetical protein